MISVPLPVPRLRDENFIFSSAKIRVNPWLDDFCRSRRFISQVKHSEKWNELDVLALNRHTFSVAFGERFFWGTQQVVDGWAFADEWPSSQRQNCARRHGFVSPPNNASTNP